MTTRAGKAEPTDEELKTLAKDLAQAFKDSGADIDSLIAFLNEELKKSKARKSPPDSLQGGDVK